MNMDKYKLSDIEKIIANNRKRERDYWLGLFSDFSGKAILPYAKDKQGEKPVYKDFKFQLPEECSSKVLKISGDSDLRAFLILLNTLFVLLKKYNIDKNDPVIGVPVFRQEEAKEIINKLLFIKHELRGEQSFKNTLISLQGKFEEAIEFQNYPSPVLLQDLGHEIQNGDCPLFDVVALMEGVHDDKYVMPYMPNLLFCFSINGKKIECNVRYNELLYDQTIIEQFVALYHNICRGALNNVSMFLADLPLLTSHEKQEIIDISTNDSGIDFPLDTSIEALWYDAVRKYGNRVAVVYDEKKLTFNKLNETSDRFYQLLLEHNIGRGEVVGIYQERSIEYVASLLALIKAGAVYLPLSTNMPLERIKFIIGDSGCKKTLTSSKFLDKINEVSQPICIDTLPSAISHKQSVTLNSADSSLYMIYTSGSTGTPKGSIVSHKNVINLVFGLNKELFSKYENSLSVALVSPFDFDASVQNMFTSLLFGHTLNIVPESVRKDGERLGEFYNNNKIQISDGTPTHLRLLLESSHTPLINNIHFLIAGETLSKSLVSEFYRQCGVSVRITNLYGPTETCVDSTFFHVQISDISKYKTLPIGKALPNEAVYILDHKGEVQPYLVPGEICIAGHGVTKGYHNRPDLTKTKFVDSPFKRGEKLYRTGDLGRLLTCGNIEFLGRIDNQIKLNGFRIELEEIEEVIKAHSWVKNVIVYVDGKEENKLLKAKIEPKNQISHQLFYLDKIEKEKLSDFIHTLPNGLKFLNKNHKETRVVFKEVFENKTYLNNGIEIKDGDTIIDVGANAGMFSLQIGLHFPKAKIFAMEPIPETFRYLQLNAELYDLNIELFNQGAADSNRTTTFGYYPLCTTISGQFPDKKCEKDVLECYYERLENCEENKENIDKVLDDVTQYESVECELVKLSTLIEDHKIEKIDLLKIDVEKSEIEVLNGIDELHWSLIKQLVIEVHDNDSNLKWVENFLLNKGYNVYIEEDSLVKNSKLYNVYASKIGEVAQGIESQITDDYDQTQICQDVEIMIKSVAAFISKKLPSYMMPSTMEIISEVPVKSNGKVDRVKVIELQGLTADNKSSADSKQGKSLPEILKLVEELLGVKSVDVNSNFQSIGLHSLKLMKLAYMVKDIMGVKLTLQELFTHNTIVKLSLLIDEIKGLSEQSASIQKAEDRDYYPLSPLQKGMFFIQYTNPDNIAYNLPEVYTVSGVLDVDRLNKAFAELVARHEVLRTSFAINEENPTQTILDLKSVNVKIETFDVGDGEENVIKNFVRPFLLSEPPLMRIGVLQKSDEEFILMIDIHHIITDEQTSSLLFKELIDLYRGEKLQGQEYQYRDYIEWSRNVNYEGQTEDYWKKVFAKPISRLRLPYDFEVPKKKTYEGGTLRFNIDQEIVDEINLISEEQKVSVYNIALSAVCIFLSKITGQDDIILGTSVSGRVHADLKKISGLFMNTCVLRNCIDQESTFLEFLKQVNLNTQEVIKHQSYPFEEIVNRYNDQRSLIQNPIFDVAYFFNDVGNHQFSYDSDHAGLSIKPYRNSTGQARFDLTFGFNSGNHGIGFFLNYNVNLFSDETISYFGDSFNSLFKELIQNKSSLLTTVKLTKDISSHVSEVDITFDL